MSKSFAELGVPAAAVHALARRGLTAPFPIQSLTIADALAGRDLCGRAPTGSGKTLAFAIPVAVRAGAAAPRRPTALILVPTRELAAQVQGVLQPLAEALGRRVASFFGGTPLGRDRQRLDAGVDIAVACPGRLADLVRSGAASLADVALVVIDEADRLADMGFLPEVRRLLDQTRGDRQTLLFSATLDGDVDVLVQRYQRNPVRHDHTPVEEQGGTVRHLFWSADPFERGRVTAELIRRCGSAIVFTRTKHSADRVAKALRREGVTAAPIHSNLTQPQRTRSLADFTTGRAQALVATDIAARGIHVDAVGLVVHYDPPMTDKDYVHRSGRTGRAGADGTVVTLVVPEKAAHVATLQRALAAPLGLTRIDLTSLSSAAATPTPPAPRVHAAPAAPAATAPSSTDRARDRRANRNRSRAGQGRGSTAGVSDRVSRPTAAAS